MARDPDRLVQTLAEAGAHVTPLTRQQSKELAQRWREAFAVAVKATTGKWQYEGHDWHAFSWGFSRALEGDAARAAYQKQAAAEWVVLAPGRDPSAWSCRGAPPPDLSPLGWDLYVFDAGCEWTMVFTHEQPTIGLYYSRREWQPAAGEPVLLPAALRQRSRSR